MRSIGARLALWYAGSATLTLVGLFIAGYYLLENQLIHGLDLLNTAQFAQIRAHLAGRVWNTPVYNRDGLASDAVIDGPAIISDTNATTVVEPSWQAAVDRRGSCWQVDLSEFSSGGQSRRRRH